MVQTRAIISHSVGIAGDVEHKREVAVMTLMEGRKPQEVGARAGVSDGATPVPRDGSDIVTESTMRSCFAARGIASDDILVQHGTGQFQVTIGDSAGGVLVSDELGLDLGGPGGAPQNGRR